MTALPDDPPLTGRRILLRPIVPRDYEYLFQVERRILGARFRGHGASGSLEQFVQSLWAGVHSQYLVVDREGGRPRGLVCAYKANLVDGWTYFAAAKFDPGDHTGSILDGVALHLEHCFETWDLRKVYLEVAEYNLHQFASLTKHLCEQEAHLKEHTRLRGRYWDEYVFAVTRERWQRWRPIVLPHVTGEGRFRQREGTIVPTAQWAGDG